MFIDELDGVGRTRGTGLGGGHDKREHTLNQILAEQALSTARTEPDKPQPRATFNNGLD